MDIRPAEGFGKAKKEEREGRKNVVDYQHKSVKQLNIPPAGLTARRCGNEMKRGYKTILSVSEKERR